MLATVSPWLTPHQLPSQYVEPQSPKPTTRSSSAPLVAPGGTFIWPPGDTMSWTFTKLKFTRVSLLLCCLQRGFLYQFNILSRHEMQYPERFRNWSLREWVCSYVAFKGILISKFNMPRWHKTKYTASNVADCFAFICEIIFLCNRPLLTIMD